MVCRVFLFCSCLLLASAAPLPWASNFESPQQACGDKLADIMSVVCTGGYNSLFRTEQSSTRRFRRQIVDECCRRSCSPSMLKLYCLADPTEPPTNVQIRKRSDSEMDGSKPSHQTEDVTKTTQESFSSEHSSQQNSIFQTPQANKQHSTTSKPTNLNRLSDNNKVINLLEPLKRSRKNKTKKHLNKSTQNETTEEDEDVLKESIPPLRHHKNHHHGRQLRGKNALGRTKKDKVSSSEIAPTPSYLIGTVKPYFADHVLVSSRSNFVHSS